MANKKKEWERSIILGELTNDNTFEQQFKTAVEEYFNQNETAQH